MNSRIQNAADKVWSLLCDKVAMPRTQLPRATGLPRDLANLAVGWLAHEGRIREECLGSRKMLTAKARENSTPS